MNIYVGNIAYSMEESDMKSAFEAFGEVASTKIITDHETGRSKGFAFVEMPDDGAARKAIEELNGSVVSGRPLRVNEARPRPARQSRNDYGGARYDREERDGYGSYGRRSGGMEKRPEDTSGGYGRRHGGQGRGRGGYGGGGNGGYDRY